MNPQLDMKRQPVNLGAEQALLGAILVNNEALHVVMPTRINADHFYDPLHAKIFGLMGDLISEKRPVTPMTLKPFFEGVALTDGLTVNEYIGRLMASAVTVLNCREYAHEVMASAARRALVTCFEESLEAVQETHTRGSMIIDDTAERLQMIQEEFAQHAHTRIDIGDAAKQAIIDLQTRMESGGEISGISTGLVDLDRYIGGWKKKQMVVIGGRPSMGKTAMAHSLLLNAAGCGHGVLYFSLEMDATALSERCMTDLAWNHQAPIEYNQLQNGKLPQEHIDRLIKARDRLRKMPFVIEQQVGLNLIQMQSIARQTKSRMERLGVSLDIICVDHMDKIKGSGYWRGNAVQEAGEKSNGLFNLGKALDVSIIALKQLSRGPENRDDKRPNLSDLRMSGDVEQDADVILFPFREAYYLERMVCQKPEDEADRLADLSSKKNLLEINIAKNRGGPTRTIKAFCDIGSAAVRNMERS